MQSPQNPRPLPPFTQELFPQPAVSVLSSYPHRGAGDPWNHSFDEQERHGQIWLTLFWRFFLIVLVLIKKEEPDIFSFKQRVWFGHWSWLWGCRSECFRQHSSLLIGREDQTMRQTETGEAKEAARALCCSSRMHGHWALESCGFLHWEHVDTLSSYQSCMGQEQGPCCNSGHCLAYE